MKTVTVTPVSVGFCNHCGAHDVYLRGDYAYQDEPMCYTCSGYHIVDTDTVNNTIDIVLKIEYNQMLDYNCDHGLCDCGSE